MESKKVFFFVARLVWTVVFCWFDSIPGKLGIAKFQKFCITSAALLDIVHVKK